MSIEQASSHQTSPHLFHIALSFLALTFAVHAFSDWVTINPIFYIGLLTISLLVFMVISVIYFIQLTKSLKAGFNQFKHSYRGHYSAFSMSLILAGLLIQPYFYELAWSFWAVGSTLQFFITTYVVRGWLYYDHWKMTDMSPIWFLPLSGLLVIPLGIPEFASLELGWMMLSIGLIFWLILFSLMLYRLFFHPLLSKKKQLSFFILATPPALGFLSYVQLSQLESPDLVARLLFYTSLFLSFLLLSQAKRFIDTPFCFDWWRIPLPFAFMTVASLTMFNLLNIPLFAYVASLFLAILSFAVLYLSLRAFRRYKFLK